MSKKTKAKATQKQSNLALIVYGLGDDQKPRAAKFLEAEIPLARKAADLMGFSSVEVDPTKLRVMLKQVGAGKVYASGWGFVPSIHEAKFDRLLKAIGAPEPTPPSPKPIVLPASWDSIAIGDLVLGQADLPANGWGQAFVEKVEKHLLHLRSKDYPEIQVVRHRSAVALLHTPDFVPAAKDRTAAPALPLAWADLAVNDLVIAQEDRAAGWWEAIVLGIDGDSLTLQWRDYPEEPKAKRQRTAVALLNPAPSKAA